MLGKERNKGDWERNINNCHSRMLLSGISTAFNSAQGGDPRTLRAATPSGMRALLNVGQALPDNKTSCHSKLDLESHRTLLRNNEILNQVQDDKRGGFTLIELLVVVLIIGILAAVALPQYQKAVWRSRTSEVKIFVKNLENAQAIYRMQNGTYAQDFSQLDIKL